LTGAPSSERDQFLAPTQLSRPLGCPIPRIGEFWGYPASRTFAELLIDAEEDRTLRAVLVGMLVEA
jgi:hypothetical protein